MKNKDIDPRYILYPIVIAISSFFLIRFVNSTDAMASATKDLSVSVGELKTIIKDYPEVRKQVYENKTDIQVIKATK